MELYIDINKAEINRSKLVPKRVEIHTQYGVHMGIRWIDPNTGQEGQPHPHQQTQAPPSIDHKALSDEQFKKKMGREHTPDINYDNLSHGTKVTDHPDHSDDFDNENSRLLGTLNGKSVDTRKVFNNLFKGISKDNLEKVFSDPHGQYKATLSGIMFMTKFSSDPNDSREGGNHLHCEINFDLTSSQGRHIGSIIRHITRKNDGLHIDNVEMELSDTAQGHNTATTIYNRSEDLWKHLSGGHPVHIKVTANISVGVYAWARKGFDFANKHELTYAKHDLEDFCSKNNLDCDEVLDKCGYGSMNDLKHAWQFASLDDGSKYKLVGNEDDRGEVRGEGHFGKAFMLGGKASWSGTKILNAEGYPHEDIQALHVDNFKKMGVLRDGTGKHQ